MNEPQTLRDLVQHALAMRGGSGRSLAASAERAGHKITHTTVNQLAAGTYRFRPAPETVRAVAWLAKVPEEVAFAAAGVPMPGPPFSEELPPGVDNLSPRSRRAAIEVLRALVEAEQKAGGEHVQRSAPITPAGGSPAAEDNVRAFPRAVEHEPEVGTTVPDQERAVANEDDTLEEEGIAQLEDP